MNILTVVENLYYPLLKKTAAKEKFNALLKECKGDIPEYFFSCDDILDSFKKKDVGEIPETINEFLFHLNVAYTWAVKKPEYTIDPRLLEKVLDTDIKGILPLSLLKTIPHWTGYVDLTGHPIELIGETVTGIFLSIVRHWTGKEGLTILYGVDSGGIDQYPRTLFFPFEDGLTLGETLSSDPSIILASDKLNITPEKAGEILFKDNFNKGYNQLLNIALLVASEFGNEDRLAINRIFKYNYIKRTGKKYSLPFLNTHRNFAVGTDHYHDLNEIAASPGGNGERRAHIRRAHWHGYWTYSSEGVKTLRVRWLKATFVSGTAKKETE